MTLVRLSPPPGPGRGPAPTRRGHLVRGPIAPVFVERGALAPEDAIDFAPATPREARAFAALRDARVVRRAGAGWWLDIVAYRAREEARSRAVLPWLIIGSLAISALATSAYVG